jgi:drug/metabolite transporter (DMT)-like permease
MEWFIYALLAPILWAGCNVLDKIILEKHIKNPISYQIVISFFDIISIIILLIIAPISTNIFGFFMGIMIGVIGVIAVIFYNKSIKDEEASRVVPLAYISSIFVPILAYIFLGEILNFQKYLGVIFILIGGILISFKKTIEKWHFSSAVKFMIISAFLWGVSSIIAKYVLNSIDYFSLTLWQFLGYIITVPLLLATSNSRENFWGYLKNFNKKIFSLMIINTIIYLIAILAFYFATSITDISLVYAIASTQPFFIFIYMLIITTIAPSIVKEKIDKSSILFKIIAICLIFIGTLLIEF